MGFEDGLRVDGLGKMNLEDESSPSHARASIPHDNLEQPPPRLFMAAAAVAAAQPLLQEDSLSQQSTAAAAPPVSGSITASNANGNRNNTPRSTGNPFTAMASSVPGAFSAVSDSVSSAATTMLTQDRMAAIQKFKNDSLAKMRPWKDFFDRNRFSKPANFTQVSNRINVNLVYYFSNCGSFVILGKGNEWAEKREKRERKKGGCVDSSESAMLWTGHGMRIPVERPQNGFMK